MTEYRHLEQEKAERLKEALPGLSEDMPESFFRLAEIFEQQVFELSRKGDDFFIPYMMNDALEDYLIIKDASLVGEYDYHSEEEPDRRRGRDEAEETVEPRLVKTDEKYGLILKKQGRTATLWFKELSHSRQCYQYHAIGHFWRKGEEHWRRLVYIAGTLYDKYQYIGEEACSKEEQELAELMEFAPFRSFSPIEASLDGTYPDTERGLERMRMLAEEAGDERFVKLLDAWEKNPTEGMKRKLIRKMNAPERETLYTLIDEKIAHASLAWPERRYEEKEEKEIRKKREECAKELSKKGFEGSYPVYRKDKLCIRVMEEHPFTLLESADYFFSLQYMVSECRLEDEGINAGFFRGFGRKGYIKKAEEF